MFLGLPLRFVLLLATVFGLAACAAPAAAPTAAPSSAASAPAAPTVSPGSTGEVVASTAIPTAAAGATALALPASPPPSATALPAAPTSYLVYRLPDGSLVRAIPGQPVLTLATPLRSASTSQAPLPWAASPDRRTIAYLSGSGLWQASTTTPTLALWLVGFDGSNPRKMHELLPPRGIDLTPGGADAFDLLPALRDQQLAWSPDGSRLAFVSAHQDQADVYTTTLDGRLTRISATSAFEVGPVWSPDGSQLAFRTTNGLGTGAGWNGAGVTVASPDGTPLRVVDAFPLREDGDATYIDGILWPDNQTLVVNLAHPPAGSCELQVLNIADGSRTTMLQHLQGVYQGLAWSPAAQTLAIRDPLGFGLFVWRPGDSDATRISDEPVGALAWAPQGDALAYSVATSGARPGVHVWAIGAEGDFRRLAEAPATRLLWSPDGQLLAADARVFQRHGQLQIEFTGALVVPLGWAGRGLYAFSRADRQAGANAGRMLFWDGAEPLVLATGLDQPAGAGVVSAPR